MKNGAHRSALPGGALFHCVTFGSVTQVHNRVDFIG